MYVSKNKFALQSFSFVYSNSGPSSARQSWVFSGGFHTSALKFSERLYINTDHMNCTPSLREVIEESLAAASPFLRFWKRKEKVPPGPRAPEWGSIPLSKWQEVQGLRCSTPWKHWLDEKHSMNPVSLNPGICLRMQVHECLQGLGKICLEILQSQTLRLYKTSC